MSKNLNKSRETVSLMFDNIAPKYDSLNHILSLGIDKAWRKKLRKSIPQNEDISIIDLASGTGDLAIELTKCNPKKILGLDISEEMIKVGRQKVSKKRLENKIELQVGDSLDTNLDSEKFDVATCAFGVRNFENLEKGLSEMRRILKKNGKIMILEFSKPNNIIFGKIYNFYFNRILPKIGAAVSKNSYAYKYLPDSVETMPYGQDFCKILEKIGFEEIRQKKLTMGIASIYYGTKIDVT